MIDTHCHIYEEYYDDILGLINELKLVGIEKIVINGCDMKSNKEILELTKKYDIVYGALGFHPTELGDYENESINWLETHINDNKIVAVGEIGLDYHYDDTDREKQISAFKQQLELAEKYNKPVIVHTRDSLQETFNIIKNYKVFGSIHAYSGSLEMAKEFIKLGFYIGIGGVCTFKNAVNVINVIKHIPMEYILLETDSPYLTPEPYRGKINTPANVRIVSQKIAEIKEIDVEEVIETTSNNANALFDF